MLLVEDFNPIWPTIFLGAWAWEGEGGWERKVPAAFSSVQFSLLFCLCLTFDIYIYKEKINYILISIKNETTLRYIH